MAYKISESQILRAVPETDKARLREFVEVFNQWCDKFNINTARRFVHFASQLWCESGCLRYVEENLNYSADGLRKTFPKYFPTLAIAQQYARKPQAIANKVYANRMGNGNEASGDGFRYKGRGLIMTTGKGNYLSYKNSGLCVGDLMAHPEWLCQKPGHTKSAMWFWMKNNINDIADLDRGERVSDGEAIVTRITKVVNGGTNGLSTRLYYYRRFRKEFGL